MIAKYLWSSSNPWTSHARCSKELCSEDLCSEKRAPLALFLAPCQMPSALHEHPTFEPRVGSCGFSGNNQGASVPGLMAEARRHGNGIKWAGLSFDRRCVTLILDSADLLPRACCGPPRFTTY